MAASERGTAVRAAWIGALATVAAAAIGALALLYSSSGHSSRSSTGKPAGPQATTDSSVGAYQRLVLSTCDRIHAAITNVADVSTSLDENGNVFYDKAALLQTAQRTLAVRTSEYNALRQQQVPASLRNQYERAWQLQQQELAALKVSVDKLQSQLPDGSVSAAQVSAAVQASQTTILPIQAQLNDAMTALAGASCKVTPN